MLASRLTELLFSRTGHPSEEEEVEVAMVPTV